MTAELSGLIERALKLWTADPNSDFPDAAVDEAMMVSRR